MKIKYILAILVFIVGALSSCYEDKGNYDYQVMNDITITLPLPEGNNVFVLGEVINIQPELVFSQGIESESLEYSWTFDGTEISTDPVLKWTIDMEGQYKDLRLAIKDQNTGVTYYGNTMISVTSVYVNDGWVVLSEKDGKTMLSYLRSTTKEIEEDGKTKNVYDCAVTKDVYSLSNGGEILGSGPVSINQHFVTQWGGQDKTSWLWVVQKGGQGCVDISGSTYQTEGRLADMFINGGYPEGFEPQQVYDLYLLSMAVGIDGRVCTRVKESYELFNTSQFLNEPVLSYNGSPVDGTMIVNEPSFMDQFGVLLYDKNSKRYLQVCDYDSYTGAVYSGRITAPVVQNEEIYEAHPTWARVDDMTGYKVHHVGVYAYQEYGSNTDGGYRAVIENEETGKLYIQDFRISNYGKAATVVSQDEVSELKEIIGNEAKNLYSLCFYQEEGKPYLLISRDNVLYLYKFDGDLGSRLIKLHTFNQTITSIATGGGSYEQYAGVGTENGEFYVLNLYKDVIEEVIKNGDSERKIVFHEKDFGNIVQVIYKLKTARGGSW